MSYDLCVRLWRGDAAGGELVDYTVAVEKGEVVLYAVHRVQVTQAGDLAVRWNCQAGKCGSSSAEVNGRPKLMCMTRMSALPRGPVTVTPLRTFPVIRDLFERWLCQDVCHVIRDHEDDKPAYSGPRFFIRHAELDMHPLDALDRRDLLREQHGLGLGNIAVCCTEVCPEYIKITDNAIIPMKERVIGQPLRSGGNASVATSSGT